MQNYSSRVPLAPFALLAKSRLQQTDTEDASLRSSFQAGRAIPLDVVMDNMIGLTAQAQSELCAVRRELQKYKSLKLTPEQQTYLENFVSFPINNV